MKTYQGVPCRTYGHTERYVKGGSCAACDRANKKKQYAENPEKVKARSKKWRDENPERHKANSKKYYAENTEIQKAHTKRWSAENRKLKNHYKALYEARKKQQTPPWVDLEKIKQIYINCPDGYEVDHKHPLSKGGLHIHYNLEAIPKHDNRVKYNKL